MASKVAIANAALIKIGASTITSLAEDSEAARLANARFDDALDAVLRAHPWNCATARATLTALAGAPNFGFAYQHVLPTDPFCLRVLAENNGYPYRVEGRRMLCDSTPVEITYVMRVTDVNLLDGLCREALAAYLARELAYPLAGSAALADRMAAEFENRIRQAQRIDAGEGTPAAQAEGSWVLNRH
ncbi:MAG: hypothetical protein ACLFOY_17310 [Desulfatibacillaceae bacterium]